MKYEEAEKIVKATKAITNYMYINYLYGKRIILPYEDGVKHVESLKSAELYINEYAKQIRIEPLQNDTITFGVLSAKEYQDIKIANLLGIGYVDLKDMQTSANK